MPIQQFGWIMGICTLLASLLVMLIAPSGDAPAVPDGLADPDGPGRLGFRGVGRTTGWVYRHPTPVVVGLMALVVPVAAGMGCLTYETNYINAFKPQTRVVRDYQARRVAARRDRRGRADRPGRGPSRPSSWAGSAPSRSACSAGSGPRASRRRRLSSRWRRCSTPTGGSPPCPSDSAARVLATKLDLIAASPQAELLGGFWNPKAAQARILVRLVEQQPAPSKAAIFAEATGLARAAFGPESYLTGLSFLMTKTTEGVIRTQWTTFFWSVLGILLMLTIALRGPVLAALAMVPTLLSVALVLGLMGWLGIKLDLATALVASVALGLVGRRHVPLPAPVPRAPASRAFEPSLFASYAVTGPGVLLSSAAVAIGFLALRFSEFVPFSNFGAMVAIATAGSTLGNVLFLPACLTLGERIMARRRRPAAVDVRVG